MTKEEIIELAIQAGFDEHHAKFDTRIKAFAKLVAEKERMACSRLCAELDMWYLVNEIESRGQE